MLRVVWFPGAVDHLYMFVGEECKLLAIIILLGCLHKQSKSSCSAVYIKMYLYKLQDLDFGKHLPSSKSAS